MKASFVKMHGLGNDYIYFDCREKPVRDPSALAKKLSDRHFSVGGDGVVLILPSRRADARMRMFNADGSEGKMCGNAIRCVVKYLYDLEGIDRGAFTIETKAGVKRVEVIEKERVRGKYVARTLRVDMGRPVFSPRRIPALFEGSRAVAQPLVVDGKNFCVTALSMGNPHCVVFTERPEALDLHRIGPLFENHSAFPERVNTEFVRVSARNALEMRVWERGSGETWACGTGACAAAVAAVLNGYCDRGREIAVRLGGGELTVNYTEKTVLMTGPAEIAFVGFAEI